MEREIWKPIEGYEDYYEVSSNGRVRSIDRSFCQFGNRGSFFQRTYKGRILQQRKNRNGYYYVVLSKDGKHKTITVHRLVAQAFIPNPNNYHVVDHINGDKTLNAAFNLRWVTESDNVRNPNTYNKMCDRLKGSHICSWRGHFGNEHPMSKSVAQYDLSGNFIAEYGSASEAGRQLGISRTCVSDCASGKCKKSHGFIFKYL